MPGFNSRYFNSRRAKTSSTQQRDIQWYPVSTVSSCVGVRQVSSKSYQSLELLTKLPGIKIREWMSVDIGRRETEAVWLFDWGLFCEQSCNTPVTDRQLVLVSNQPDHMTNVFLFCTIIRSQTDLLYLCNETELILFITFIVT